MNSFPIDSDNVQLSSNNNNDQEKQKDCYFKYIYYYKALTQDQEGLDKLKRRKCPFCKLFLSKYIPHSTLFFIFPWFWFTKNDKDGYCIKFTVLILYIALFMTFNMSTEYNLSYLYLIFNRWYDDSINTGALMVNILVPFLILYVPIAIIKKSLSMTFFCLEENVRIKDYERKYRIYNPSKYKIKIQLEKSRINKYRNKMETNYKIILLYGTIFLLFNWVYATAFFGIYKHSFKNIVINILSSMACTLVISLVLHFFSTVIKYSNWKCCKKFKFILADFIDCKIFVDFFSKIIWNITLSIFSYCFKEEHRFEEEINEKNNNTDINTNYTTNTNDNNTNPNNDNITINNHINNTNDNNNTDTNNDDIRINLQNNNRFNENLFNVDFKEYKHY